MTDNKFPKDVDFISHEAKRKEGVAMISTKKNIIEWVYDDNRDIMILHRADGSRCEFENPKAIKKLPMDDIYDLFDLKLQNPSNTASGREAEKILSEIKEIELKKQKGSLKRLAGRETKGIVMEGQEKTRIIYRGPPINVDPPSGISLPSGTVIAKPKGMYFSNGTTLMFVRVEDLWAVPVPALQRMLKMVLDGEGAEEMKQKIKEQIKRKGSDY